MEELNYSNEHTRMGTAHSTQHISQLETSFKLKGFKGIPRYGVFAISNSYCYDFRNSMFSKLPV